MLDPRSLQIQKIRENPRFDAVIVGGGINGIGTFRDLSLQGLRVLLIDRNDFCSGCSAAPSRMIHGGLRYLENGEFDLVKESLFERDSLLKNAPHMVFPLPTVVPITTVLSGLLNSVLNFFGKRGIPKQRGIIPIKLGLMFYDFLTRNRRLLQKHEILGRKAALSLWPEFTDKLRFAAIYYDAWISHPERLGVELIVDAEEENIQCIALNYATISKIGDKIAITDSETGELIQIDPRVIINSTGAWLDETAASLGSNPKSQMVSGTKGSHLIIDNSKLLSALKGHMVYFENYDGRVCIVFPYLGKVLAGATDIRVKKASRVRCDDGERDYILGSLRLIFPNIELSENNIIYSYSGIRPLPKDDVEFTGRISREHFTLKLDGHIPQFCMVGGKWTTFRAFAEQTTDMVLVELQLKRKQNTKNIPIGGGKNFDSSSSDRISSIYGSKRLSFDSSIPLVSGFDLSIGEVKYLIEVEKARRLSDILQRRLPICITGQINGGLIKATAFAMGAFLNWDQQRIDNEIIEFSSDLVQYHGVQPSRLKV
ncbi:MAG: glycerol-3-phosphate dehydrogenase/oxidase [Alphaproteobacteria bacterium]